MSPPQSFFMYATELHSHSNLSSQLRLAHLASLALRMALYLGIVAFSGTVYYLQFLASGTHWDRTEGNGVRRVYI